MSRRCIYRLIAASLLSGLLPAVATAEVQQRLNYDYYPVRIEAGETLTVALHRATPIREENRRYHGFAYWTVNWNFWWQSTAQTCHVKNVEVGLEGTIRLPRLEGGSVEQSQRFDRYLAALRKHELGHIGIGQRAAREIEWGIHRLAEATSCDELEASVNQVGQRILHYYQGLDERYDRETGHGRTQGVVLNGH